MSKCEDKSDGEDDQRKQESVWRGAMGHRDEVPTDLAIPRRRGKACGEKMHGKW
jgi:hypothetical protein